MRFILRVWLQPSAYVDEEGVPFVLSVFTPIKQRVCLNLHALKERVLRWIKPLTTSLVLETFADLTRGKAELLAENTLLRHQLIILRRQVKRPVYKKTDRFLLVFLAGMVRAWKRALFLVQPETLLRWHRELFRLFWKHKSKAQARKPRLSLETISLIKDMAANNRLWGAERIRGELLKLNMNVLITSSFTMRNNSPGFSWRMQCTSIIPDLIKESISRSRLC
jgi:putative transposase